MGRLIRGISKNARFFVADTTDVVQEALDIHKYDEYSMKIFGKFQTIKLIHLKNSKILKLC